MKIAALIARILLGLLFLFVGLNAFFNFVHPPPIPGLAGQFTAVFLQSHYVMYVGAIEIIASILLLTKQFVPLALVLLAPVLFNILVFHLTMAIQGAPFALFLLLLWGLAAWRVRAYLLPLLAPKAAER